MVTQAISAKPSFALPVTIGRRLQTKVDGVNMNQAFELICWCW
jgi:hypothetical protein